jgi:phosphoribosylamine---glycine ligase
MKVLVIGGGGREHAILWALKRTSQEALTLYCAPGNAGISEIAECLPISPGAQDELIEFARETDIDLTIVGPEAPLAAGIVDAFASAGLRIVGPTSAASRLESSKAFAKDFMQRHRIPTANYLVTSSAGEALEALRSGKFGSADSAVVVKADGLAAGKGVVVARSRKEAEKAIIELTAGTLVAAEASKLILLEAALEGREVSVLLFADGHDYALMPPARDHKRIGENDIGPNTGGMGAITDESVVDQKTLERIVREVVEPTLKGAAAEGFPFHGILFVGLMLTEDGPKVLEYNVRFGDPETQAILIRLESDLLRIFEATIDGRLRDVDIQWSDQSSACVVLASAGYPGAYESGCLIEGLESLVPDDRLQIFHSGTSKSADNGLVTAGGRVLGITAAGATLKEALTRCYEAVSKISWPGIQFRRDIGDFNERQRAGS